MFSARLLLAGGVLTAIIASPVLATAADGTSAVSTAVLSGIDRRYFYRHQGRNLDESVEAMEALLAARPDDPALLWRLGRSVVRVGERKQKKERLAAFERAQGLLEKAVGLDPSNPEAHYWLGVAVGRQGQLRGIFKSLSLVGVMRREMEAVLKLDYNHGGAHHVLGEMYRELPRFVGGSKKKSLAELELAFKLAPDYTASYAALAEAYRDLGEDEKAAAVLNRIFEVKTPQDPAEFEDNLKEARELLEKLGDGR
ncbi:MAG: tetratricopeptide repeat protein [Elusimicrobia bacterium]|nr:tetratricopeptide repeat protein [Elusimicrobiota bacterium]